MGLPQKHHLFARGGGTTIWTKGSMEEGSYGQYGQAVEPHGHSETTSPTSARTHGRGWLASTPQSNRRGKTPKNHTAHIFLQRPAKETRLGLLRRPMGDLARQPPHRTRVRVSTTGRRGGGRGHKLASPSTAERDTHPRIYQQSLVGHLPPAV